MLFLKASLLFGYIGKASKLWSHSYGPYITCICQMVRDFAMAVAVKNEVPMAGGRLKSSGSFDGLGFAGTT